MENDYLDELKEKVLNCFIGASTATGSRLEYKWAARYDSLRNNMQMAQLFVNNMNSLGRPAALTHSGTAFGSTDMGNVSQIVPSIHGFVSIAEKGTLVHSPDFAIAAASEKGMEAMLDAAKVIGMTAFDLFADSEALKRVKEEFAQTK
jgi:metal-dependent amidase/aminoacylase/carboxypeptidase family protein